MVDNHWCILISFGFGMKIFVILAKKRLNTFEAPCKPNTYQLHECLNASYNINVLCTAEKGEEWPIMKVYGN